MALKYLLIIHVILFGPSWSYGQKKDSAFCKGDMQYEVNAFIRGHQYESSVDEDILKKDFDLALSDSSYTLIGFRISWSDQQGIYVSPIEGSRVIQTEQKYPLNIAKGISIAFDCITIKKGSAVYKAPAFVIYATTAAQAEEHRKNLATMVHIPGYKNRNIVPYTVFRNDLELEISDSSYKIIDFVLTWDEENGDVFSAEFQGNKILVKRDARTDLSRKLRPGATVTIENIRVEKNGKLYRAPSLIIYLK